MFFPPTFHRAPSASWWQGLALRELHWHAALARERGRHAREEGPEPGLHVYAALPGLLQCQERLVREPNSLEVGPTKCPEHIFRTKNICNDGNGINH